jgi:hypothetical protein
MRRLVEIQRDREANIAVAREKYGPTLRARIETLIAAYDRWKSRGGNPDVILTIPWTGVDTLTAYLGIEPPEPLSAPTSPREAAELYLLREDRDPEAAAIIASLTRRRKPRTLALIEIAPEDDAE